MANPQLKNLINSLTLLLLYSYISASGYPSPRIDLSDTSIQFYSVVGKADFDTLHGRDFTWLIYKPINDTISFIRFDHRDDFISHLSNQQKALFYICQLEAAVVGGDLGFYNYYYNYKSSFPETIKSLKLIKDTAMLNLMFKVNKTYLEHEKKISQNSKSSSLKYVKNQFAFAYSVFWDKNEHTMNLLEGYIRLHQSEFVRFK
jgi:hypothetical protein